MESELKREPLETETAEARCFHWLPPRFEFRFFSYAAQARLPRDGAAHAHGGLGSLSSISDQENATDMPTGQVDGGSSSAEGPSSHVHVRFTSSGLMALI